MIGLEIRAETMRFTTTSIMIVSKVSKTTKYRILSIPWVNAEYGITPTSFQPV